MVDAKAQAEQVRSVDAVRFVSRRGALDALKLAELNDALLLHLDLEPTD